MAPSYDMDAKAVVHWKSVYVGNTGTGMRRGVVEDRTNRFADTICGEKKGWNDIRPLKLVMFDFDAHARLTNERCTFNVGDWTQCNSYTVKSGKTSRLPAFERRTEQPSVSARC